MSVEDTLVTRGKRYGSFDSFSDVSQRLKGVIHESLEDRGKILSNPHKEAIDMILHKISRIINGDPYYTDNWHDIAGYAKLAEDYCITPKKDDKYPPQYLAEKEMYEKMYEDFNRRRKDNVPQVNTG